MLKNNLLRVLIVGFFAIGCARTASRQQATLPLQAPSISVMTYNLNFEIAGDQDTIGVVEKDNPDVVFFQEANEVWTQSLQDRLGYRYKHVTFRIDDPYAAGIGMMSKYPIVSTEYLPKVDWFPALRVVLDTPLGHLQVLNVHLRPPVSKPGGFVLGAFQTPGIRRHEISEFATYLDPNLPTLIVGDFNENEYGRAVSWLEDHGYRSSLPEFSPNAKTWRWPLTSYVSMRERYDHLCYNDLLEPKSVTVENAGWSDHLPVMGVFTLK
jgi:endonuclease/exonuclease/phosphatase (EEP) superfamily protein YafD